MDHTTSLACVCYVLQGSFLQPTPQHVTIARLAGLIRTGIPRIRALRVLLGFLPWKARQGPAQPALRVALHQQLAVKGCWAAERCFPKCSGTNFRGMVSRAMEAYLENEPLGILGPNAGSS